MSFKKAIIHFLRFLPDKTFLKLKYFVVFKKRLSFSKPKNYNEKIQWLKLYERDDAYTKMVDKCEAKKYVKSMINEINIIPTIGVWDSFDEIDFSLLPDRFVIKCTHDSNSLIICKDKNSFNINDARKKINKCLKNNFYYEGREWVYKNVKPRIIIEPFVFDESGCELKDYKVFCFNGVPKMIQVDTGRFGNHIRNLYTTEWEYIDASINFPNDSNTHFSRPTKLKQMLEYASILSQNIKHLRCDFYIINGEIYFGELTFFHGSGYNKFYPEEFNKIMGEWISLEEQVEEKNSEE